MRKFALGVGSCLGLWIAFNLFGVTILADGGYTHSVTVVSQGGSPITTVRWDTANLSAESIRRLEQNEARWEFRESSSPQPPAAVHTLSVMVPCSGHYNGFWWERKHSQQRHLVVEVQYQDGNLTLTVVELPDCRKVKSTRVEVP